MTTLTRTQVKSIKAGDVITDIDFTNDGNDPADTTVDIPRGQVDLYLIVDVEINDDLVTIWFDKDIARRFGFDESYTLNVSDFVWKV